MNYQVLDVKVKDTEETAKLYTYFLDNSREIAPERVRPVADVDAGKLWDLFRLGGVAVLVFLDHV